MNKDQTIALLTGIAKVVGAILAAHGATQAATLVTSADLIEAVSGVVITLTSFYASHKYNSDAPAAKEGSPAINASLVIAALLLSFGFVTGCATNQQRIAYNSLYSVEKVTVGSYDGYIDSVISGMSTTNGVPAVSKKFNQFQSSFVVALDAAQFNTNAIAPASLVIESEDVINLIATFKSK